MRKVVIKCPNCGVYNEVLDDDQEKYCAKCGNVLFISDGKSITFLTYLISAVLFIIAAIAVFLIVAFTTQISTLENPLTLCIPFIGLTIIATTAVIFGRRNLKRRGSIYTLIGLAVGIVITDIISERVNALIISHHITMSIPVAAKIAYIIFVALCLYTIHKSK